MNAFSRVLHLRRYGAHHTDCGRRVASMSRKTFPKHESIPEKLHFEDHKRAWKKWERCIYCVAAIKNTPMEPKLIVHYAGSGFAPLCQDQNAEHFHSNAFEQNLTGEWYDKCKKCESAYVLIALSKMAL